MADLDTYASAVRVQTRQVFMAIYPHPFLLLKLEEPSVTPAPEGDDDWESHTRVSVGIGKTGSFSVLRHNAGLYRVYPLKPGNPASKRAAGEALPPPPPVPEDSCPVPAPAEAAQKPESVTITLGRISANDIVIVDNAISKHHADFNLLANGDVTLVDHNSKNGTSVRGRRLVPGVPTAVSFGDPVVMGGLALILIGAGALWEIIHSQVMQTPTRSP